MTTAAADVLRPLAQPWQSRVPYFVLGVSLLLTGASTYYLVVTSASRDRLRFDGVVQKTRDSIEGRMETYITLLRATSGLFATNESVSREQFRTFVERMDLPRRHPGIQGIGFSQRVGAPGKDAFVAAQRNGGASAFSIRPESERPEYHAIVYLEPLDRRNEVAIGYDMSTEPVRRSAMERACDTGRPAASGPVTLVQEIDEKKQAGFLVYLPVYGGGRAPQTVDERRAALAGFVYGPFRVDDLMRGILGGGTHPGIAFRIFAGPEAAPSLLYRSDEAPGSLAESTLTAVVALDVAGYPWSIRFSALPAFADGSRKGESVLLFLVGVAVSLVLFGVSRAQVRARAAAERTAADLRRSEDARRESEERARLILDSALDAVITIDREGRITGWNPQAARLFGWPREEAVGRLLADTIIPSAHRDAHWRGLARYLATGETRVLGRRIEVDALARDGREFAVELAITPVVSGGAVGFSAFLRDISERKAAEDEIRALNTDLTRRVEERTADLTAANRELEAFSYSVSHDLRAPLRAIDGFSRIVLDEYGTGLPDDARGLLHRVIEGAHRMDALINDLLAFSRLVHQPLVRTEIALEPLIKDVLVELGASGHADVMVGDVALCVGDPRLLRQVYLNLLSNALKFTRRRAAAAIEIGSRSADGDTVYFVRDNGVGFDMKNAQKLFGVFQRLHRAEEYEGTGVGLAIVQRIVHRHGGRIWAEAMVDRGATFYFTLGGAAGS